MGLDQSFHVLVKKPKEIEVGEQIPYNSDKFWNYLYRDANLICSKLISMKYAIPVSVELRNKDYDKCYADLLKEQNVNPEHYHLFSICGDRYTFCSSNADESDISIDIDEKIFEKYIYYEYSDKIAILDMDEICDFRKNYALQKYMETLGYAGDCFYLYVSRSDLITAIDKFPDFYKKYCEEKSYDFYSEDLYEVLKGFVLCLVALAEYENDCYEPIIIYFESR